MTKRIIDPVQWSAEQAAARVLWLEGELAAAQEHARHVERDRAMLLETVEALEAENAACAAACRQLQELVDCPICGVRPGQPGAHHWAQCGRWHSERWEVGAPKSYTEDVEPCAELLAGAP